MRTKVLRCDLCYRVFNVPVGYYERVHVNYRCEECIGVVWALEHNHMLYVQWTAPDRLLDAQLRLLAVDPKPDASNRISTKDGGKRYSFTFWYEKISKEIVEILASLRVWYSLYDLELDEDSLLVRPGYKNPGAS